MVFSDTGKQKSVLIIGTVYVHQLKVCLSVKHVTHAVFVFTGIVCLLALVGFHTGSWPHTQREPASKHFREVGDGL